METRTALLAFLLLAVGFAVGRWTHSVPPTATPLAVPLPRAERKAAGPVTLGGAETVASDERERLVEAAPKTEGPAVGEAPAEEREVEVWIRPLRQAVERTRLEELRFLALRELDERIAEAVETYESILRSPPSVNTDYIRAASAEQLSRQQELRDWRRRIATTKTLESFLREASQEPEDLGVELLKTVYGR